MYKILGGGSVGHEKITKYLANNADNFKENFGGQKRQVYPLGNEMVHI